MVNIVGQGYNFESAELDDLTMAEDKSISCRNTSQNGDDFINRIINEFYRDFVVIA